MNTIKFVKKNLNYRKDAEELLSVFIREEEISIAIVSEPYSARLKNWFYDWSGAAAIGFFRPDLSIVDLKVGDGFVAATVAGSFRLYSCFAKSSLTDFEFKNFISFLEASAAEYRKKGMVVIIAGDFNTHSVVWPNYYKGTKGYCLRKLQNSLEMEANREIIPTFFSIELGPIVHVTLVSNTASRRIQGWRVCMSTENMNGHHHYHITFSLADHASDSPSSVATGSCHQDISHLIKTFEGISEWVEGKAQCLDLSPSDEKEPVVERQVSCLTSWNTDFPPRKRLHTNRQIPGWWNDKIETVRVETIRLKRKLSRARKRDVSDEKITMIVKDYQMAKKKFKHLICKTKAKYYRHRFDGE